MSAKVVVCCGSGGVGKTTISAALALKWALEGQRVAVLTIDPARRLADSLDIGELDNTPRPVPLERLDPTCTGSLDAMMLDAKDTFDEMVRRLARSPQSAQRILEHRYYRFASSRLGGSHEYMAMERLYTLWQDGPYDIIVLDTPPTRHALDFLRAPQRMAGLMDQGVMRWLVMPATKGGWRALELGSEVIAKALKRVMGQGTVSEIADFFDVFRDIWDGFRERSEKVDELLRGTGTHFFLVSTPAPTSRADANYFVDVLAERKLPFAGFLVNRTVAPPVHAQVSEQALAVESDLSEERWQAVQGALTRVHSLRQRLSADHLESIAALRASAPKGTGCWTVPEQPRDLHDLESLASLSPHLPAPPR